MANRYDNDMSMSKSIFDENIILRGVMSITSCTYYYRIRVYFIWFFALLFF